MTRLEITLVAVGLVFVLAGSWLWTRLAPFDGLPLALAVVAAAVGVAFAWSLIDGRREL